MLSGCMTVGKKFDISKVDQLQPGVSTEADAKALFGEPTSVSANPDNHHELLQWVYSQGTLVGGNGSHLAISFGCVYFRTTAKYVQNDAVRLIRLGWANG
jgi:hypothetical protein